MLYPASSFLNHINDYKAGLTAEPLSPAQGEDLVPEPEAGHGGGAARDHEGHEHTLVVGGDPQTDLERGEWGNGALLLLIYLAVTILAEDDPSREPGIDDRERVTVGD